MKHLNNFQAQTRHSLQQIKGGGQPYKVTRIQRLSPIDLLACRDGQYDRIKLFMDDNASNEYSG